MSPIPTPKAGATPSYDVLQQVFSLNWLANVTGFKFGSQEKLQAEATAAINGTLADPEVVGLVGNYETVWGPVVYQFPGGGGKPASNVIDNLMYVAKTSTTVGTRYVVALAATNPVSWFGWIVEDFWVAQTVPWPGAPSAMISAGANTGLGILLNMVSNGQTLPAFLAQVVANAGPGAIEVVVSGHSLGGTLSPLVALELAEQQGQPAGWDPNRRAIVSAVPSAGFTPGNQAFADYLESVIGLHTTRIWNRLDMVGAAFNADALQHAPYLFYPFIVPNTLVQAMTDLLILLAKSSGQAYVQFNRQTPPLDAPVDLGLASMQLKVPGATQVQFAQRVVQAATVKFNLHPDAAVPLRHAVETVLQEVTNEWSKPRHARADSAVTAIHVACDRARQQLGTTTAPVVLPGVDDLVGEIEGLIVFFAQALIQHVMPYLQILGVNEFVKVMTKYASGPKAGESRSQPKIVELPGAAAATRREN